MFIHLLHLVYAVTWMAIIGIAVWKPWIILRPSVWVALLMTVHLSGAAAFVSGEYNYFGSPKLQVLLKLDQFRFLTLLFPLTVLLYAILTPGFSSRARRLYAKCRSSMFVTDKRSKTREIRLTIKMVAAAILLLGVYLINVPLQTTGLWANIFDSMNSAQAREDSLTLQESPIVRYGFSWYVSTVAPACAGLLWFAGRMSRSRLKSFMVLIGIAAIIVSVMLTGARAPGGSLIIKLGIGYLLVHGFKRGGQILVLSASGALFLALMLSISRDNLMGNFSLSLIWFYLDHGIFERIFVSPFSTGVYTNLYAQDTGLLGFSNIRPLATLFGSEHLNLAQAVGMRYVDGATESIGMNTCFLFDYQASFGMIAGFIVALVSVAALDVCILSFRKIDGAVLVSFYAVFLGSLMSLTSSAFFVSLNTSGILLIAFLAWLVGNIYYRRTTKCAG